MADKLVAWAKDAVQDALVEGHRAGMHNGAELRNCPLCAVAEAERIVEAGDG